MRTLLIILLLCGSADILSTTISNSTIDSDIAELVNLYNELQLAKPVSVHRAREAACQIISKCCPELKSTFLSLVISGKSREFVDQCFGKIGSSSFLTKILKCFPFIKIITAVVHPQNRKYQVATRGILAGEKKDLESVIQACSSEEFLSIVCNWNKYDKMENCQRRLLEKYAQQGDSVYTNKVQKTKESMRRIIDKIKKALNA